MTDIFEKLPAPTQKEGEGIEVVREGLDLIRSLVSDERNIVISPEAFYLQGFIHDLFTEYKEFSVIRTRPGGVVSVYARAVGRYYPAFIMYDAQGEPDHVVTVYVGDERKGVAVARAHDNRSYVFILSEPCDFNGTAHITLTTPDTQGGTYRIEKILLIKEKPSIKPREYLFTDVKAVPIYRRGDVEVRITWITNWATSSRVEYGLSPSYGSSVEDETLLNNHCVTLTGLDKNRTYHYRLLGRTPDGKIVASQDYTFTTTPQKREEGLVERETVPLYVENKLNVLIEKWPVTFGIPFPKGTLTSPENVRVLNPIGEEVPIQVSVLGEWPDGSIKWLLVDFQADVKPMSQAEYKLEFGRAILRKEKKLGVIVNQKGSIIEVVTGPLKLVIDPAEPYFPGRVWLDQDGDGIFSPDEELTEPILEGTMELIDAYGKVYNNLKGPCRAEIEEEGPLRVVVKVVGEHQAEDGSRLFNYVTRIHAYAGKSFIRVFHTWENDYLDDDFIRIRSLILKTPLRLQNPFCILLGDGVYQSNNNPTLFQSLDDDYTIVEEGIIRDRGKRAKGLIDLSDRRWGLTVVVRDFWQNYPKSLGSDANTIIVGICPPLPRQLYPPIADLEDKLYYYLLNGEYKLKQGISKTHELLYYFHKGNFKAANAEVYAEFLREPIIVRAPPLWYRDSKALGDFAVANRERFQNYEENINKAFDRYLKNREDGREYGMLNFGDWWGERGFDWGNMEYDTPQAFILQYIRSGDSRFFKAAEEAARHYMDVDTVHHSRDRKRVGMVYAHCLCHVGDYYPDNYRKGAISSGLGTISHTWIDGLLDYYFLTGYRRSFEVAKKIADRYASYYTVNYDFTNCRNPGWHLILTTAMYNATYDEFYLNAAKIIVRRVLERQTPNVGGWLRQMMPGHCHCIPRHRGNAGFMVGILLSGLKRYHEITGDKSVADSIVKGADFLINDMWIPNLKCFRYTSCPKSEAAPLLNSLILEGISYAHRLSGKERFKDIVIIGMESVIEDLSFGKSISQYMRFTPYTLYDIEHYLRKV